jgi:hypothetical protein
LPAPTGEHIVTPPSPNRRHPTQLTVEVLQLRAAAAASDEALAASAEEAAALRSELARSRAHAADLEGRLAAAGVPRRSGDSDAGGGRAGAAARLPSLMGDDAPLEQLHFEVSCRALCIADAARPRNL